MYVSLRGLGQTTDDLQTASYIPTETDILNPASIATSEAVAPGEAELETIPTPAGSVVGADLVLPDTSGSSLIPPPASQNATQANAGTPATVNPAFTAPAMVVTPIMLPNGVAVNPQALTAAQLALTPTQLQAQLYPAGSVPFSLSTWLTESTILSGVSNQTVALAGIVFGGVLVVILAKKRRGETCLFDPNPGPTVETSRCEVRAEAPFPIIKKSVSSCPPTQQKIFPAWGSSRSSAVRSGRA